MITPSSAVSTIFISMTESSKTRITGTGSQPLYVGDKSVWVETGWASAANKNLSLDLDERTELSYIAQTNTGDTLRLVKWKMWLRQVWSIGRTEMKNLTVLTKEGDIVMLEQTNPVFSIAYAIQWDITISTSIWDYLLKAWNRIMLSATELSNPGLQIDTQVGTINDDIMNNAIFVRNNWKELLNSLVWIKVNTGTTETDTGSISPPSEISFLEPIDWSLSTKTSIQIRWNINSKEIKKITVNDTFTFVDFPIIAEVNNIVYKAYNTDGKEVTKGVITVYWSKQSIQNINKLISNNSPISSKDFSIISPSTNPFFTTDRFMKVQWVVPKDKVSYILVNDYRLQKYIAWNTSWYYFANMDTDTMRDGINSYKIEFYWIKNDLLYTQLFTIIKESKHATISGESSR